MFRNFTPHPINLIGFGEIPSEGVARISEIRNESKVAWPECPATHTTIRYGEIEGMPDLGKANDVIIVSRPIAERIHRPDVVCPDKLVRDAKGNIIGCEGFAWFPNF